MENARRFILPMLALVAAAAAWFPVRRRLGKSAPLGSRMQLALEAICALPLVASGTLHLFKPGAFTPLLSPSIPYRTWIVVLTGIPEWAGAIGLFLPRTRRAASLWLAVFMIAIFPANIYVAGETIGGLAMPSVPVRWTMQVLYIWLLLFTGDREYAAAGGATRLQAPVK